MSSRLPRFRANTRSKAAAPDAVSAEPPAAPVVVLADAEPTADATTAAPRRSGRNAARGRKPLGNIGNTASKAPATAAKKPGRGAAPPAVPRVSSRRRGGVASTAPASEPVPTVVDTADTDVGVDADANDALDISKETAASLAHKLLEAGEFNDLPALLTRKPCPANVLDVTLTSVKANRFLKSCYKCLMKTREGLSALLAKRDEFLKHVDAADAVATAAAAELSARCAAAERQVETLTASLQSVEATLSTVATDHTALTARHDALAEAHAVMTSEFEDTAAKLAVASEQAAAAAAAQQELAAHKEATASKLEGLHAEVARLTGVSEQREADNQQLMNTVNSLKVDMATLEAQKSGAEEARAALTADLTEVKATLEARERHMTETLASFSKAQEMHSTREREMTKDRDTLAAKVATLQAERDALYTSEVALKSEVATVSANATRIQAELDGKAAEFESANTAAATASDEAQRCRMEVERIKAEMSRVLSTTAATKEDLEAKLIVATSARAVAEDRVNTMRQQVEALEADKAALHDATESVKAQLSAKGGELQVLSAELQTLKDNTTVSSSEQLTRLCAVSKEAEELRHRMVDLEAMRHRLAEAEAAIEDLNGKLCEGEMTRRKLHNLVQELRGNIRCYIRVRPTLSQDGTSVALTQLPAVGLKAGASAAGAKATSFAFDHVFSPSTTQEQVFDNVSQFVQSALDGYQVCLFSYGQTGSGKTHTMQGGEGDAAGIIPRSVNAILKAAQGMVAQGWEYKLHASFLEVYNESVRDLLRPVGDPRPNSLSMHAAADGTVALPELTTVEVEDATTVETLLVKAAKSRSVASTSMNAHSSRSHSVFTLQISGANAARRVAVSGTLNLVDLAGSERLDRSKAEGARLKETQAINKSLSCLVDVFTALGRKAPHVPYRNSKLTQLLRPCFSGDGKVLTIINLSPTHESAGETLCSLRFAAQVNQIEMGKAKKKIAAIGGAGAGAGAGVGAGAGAASRGAATPASAGARTPRGSGRATPKPRPASSRAGGRLPPSGARGRRAATGAPTAAEPSKAKRGRL